MRPVTSRVPRFPPNDLAYDTEAESWRVARGPMGIRDLLVLRPGTDHDLRGDVTHPGRRAASAATPARERRSVGAEHQALVGERAGGWRGRLDRGGPGAR